jgi:hypothetical protein
MARMTTTSASHALTTKQIRPAMTPRATQPPWWRLPRRRGFPGRGGCGRGGYSTAPIVAFSAAPTGCFTVYAARLTCLTGRGVMAFLAVLAGCTALRTDRGVALRTDLRTALLANLLPKPMTTSPFPCPRLRRRTAAATG